MKNFVYLVGAEGAPDAAVVDPAWDVGAILNAAAEDGRVISGVVVTHHHADHRNGLEALLAAVDVPVYVQKAELEFSEIFRPFAGAIHPVGPGEAVVLGGMRATLIHTPGHTPGSQCVLCGGALVSGDTVFVNACGRCDFPGGDMNAMFDSLHRVLGELPGDTVLYPGHDYGDVPVSSLAREREFNPYFRQSTLEAFRATRGRPRT